MMIWRMLVRMRKRRKRMSVVSNLLPFIQCIFSLWVIPNVQILGALSSERNLMMATVVWWAVCYSPADIVYSIATNKVSATMPGYRPGKVLQGTRAAGSRARAL